MELSAELMRLVHLAGILTRQQERDLIIKSQAGDIDATQSLVIANLRWVFRNSEYYFGRGVPTEDLFQIGVEALINSIMDFDTKRKVRLNTYATWWIRCSMRRATEHGNTIIRMPQLSNLKKLRTARDREQVKRISQGIWSIYGTHLHKGSNDGQFAIDKNSLLNKVVFSSAELSLEKKEVREILRDIRRTFPRRQRLLLWARQRGWTFVKIGRALRFSGERARVLYAEAKSIYLEMIRTSTRLLEYYREEQEHDTLTRCLQGKPISDNDLRKALRLEGEV